MTPPIHRWCAVLALIIAGCAKPDRSIQSAAHVGTNALLRATLSVRIGAWNIENLGTRGADSQSPNQSPRELAKYISSTGVDVLALCEIHDDEQPSSDVPGRAPWRNDILEKALKELDGIQGASWKYVLTAPGSANRRQQMTGVAWNTSRVKLQKRFVVPVPGGIVDGAAIWARTPEAFKFSLGDGLTDFVLVPLHMKSNTDGEETGKKVRRIEAQQLAQQLSKVATTLVDSDIVLLGDTNMLPGEKTAQTEWASRYRDLNAAERYTYVKPFRDKPLPPFDRIFVPKEQREFASAQQQQIHGPFGSTEAQRRAWIADHLQKRSDHLLIYADVSISSDDD